MQAKIWQNLHNLRSWWIHQRWRRPWRKQWRCHINMPTFPWILWALWTRRLLLQCVFVVTVSKMLHFMAHEKGGSPRQRHHRYCYGGGGDTTRGRKKNRGLRRHCSYGGGRRRWRAQVGVGGQWCRACNDWGNCSHGRWEPNCGTYIAYYHPWMKFDYG